MKKNSFLPITFFLLVLLFLPIASLAGSISGQVTRDSDGTGIQDVWVDVWNSYWNFVNSASTDSSGNYTVADLAQGVYYVTTWNNLGYIDEYYNNVTSQSAATSVSVLQDSNTRNINFGLSLPGSISGRVTKDSDGTGIQNVSVHVWNSNWNFVKSTSTDSSGNYTVGGLAPGSYYVSTYHSLGYIDEYYNNVTSQSAATLVSVTQGSNTPNINFGLALPGSISGLVTKDSDGTGIQNVEIDVWNSSWNLVKSTSTDSSGNYTVDGLAPGGYYVSTYQSLGYLDEYYNNVASQSAATLVNVTQDANTPNINFGLALGVSISGYRWISIGPEGRFVYALAINPQTPETLYAGTDGGVFKSTNGGTSWTAMNTGLPFSKNVYALAINPQTPDTIYAGIANYSEGYDGVFKSTNGGTNWTAINNGLTYTYIRALAINPQTPETLYAGGGYYYKFGYYDYAYKSINGGTNWTDISFSRAVISLAINPQAPDTLYAGTFSGVFKSINGGTNWTAINTGFPYTYNNTFVYALAINPQTPETIYAGIEAYGEGYGVFKSINGGTNWTGINTGLTNTYVHALAINPQTPETIYAGTYGGGMFKSINGGTNWTAINTGLTNNSVRALAINPQTPEIIYAGTDGGGVFKIQQIIYVSLDGVCNSKSPCFTTLQNGINAAEAFAAIYVTQETYNENVILDDPKALTLQGGWDTTFTNCLSRTTINGSLTISDGTLVVENIVLQ